MEAINEKGENNVALRVPNGHLELTKRERDRALDLSFMIAGACACVVESKALQLPELVMEKRILALADLISNNPEGPTRLRSLLE